MRRALPAVAATGLSLLALLVFLRVPEEPRHPAVAPEGAGPSHNLILISIDTLRADHLGMYGYARDTSPHLDHFAARGMLFSNAISASSWTVPAHATMLTGLHPLAHGLNHYPAPGRLSPDVQTLAETMTAAGFRTAAFTGGGFMADRHGLDQGFATYESRGLRFAPNLAAATAWLDAGSPEDPFFLFLHGFDVHKPYEPEPPDSERFADGYTGSYDIDTFQPDQPRPNETDLNYVISQYDGEIASVDRTLWAFLEDLDDRGRLADTLVVITSDHGDEFYDHGSVDHIHTLYDELIRVPLLVVGPGIRPGRTNGLVGTIDIVPTVLDLLGVTAQPTTHGVSRAAWLTDETAPLEERPVFSYTGFSDYPYFLQSVTTPTHKLVRWQLSGMKAVTLPPDRPRHTYKFREETQDFFEVFDRRADPTESSPLSRDPSHETQNALHNALSQWLATPGGIADTPPTADEAYLEELRSLGYLDGPGP